MDMTVLYIAVKVSISKVSIKFDHNIRSRHKQAMYHIEKQD